MKIPTTALMSVVLVLTALSTIVGPTFNVNVTNFPLDEHGNIKVTQMNGDEAEPSWKVINLVENFNLTWTPSLDPRWVSSDLIDLGSVNVSGYSRMKLYMRVTDFTDLYQGSPNEAKVELITKSLYDYGGIWRGGALVHWTWSTPLQTLFAEFPGGDSMRETLEPSLGIYVIGRSNTPNGPVLPSISCLISISIYLRNE